MPGMVIETANPFMDAALIEAASAAGRDEVPVGAVVVRAASRVIVARAGNRMVEFGDPTAHAEMLAIREAIQTVGDPRLVDCDIYVTLEPCPMCAQAISFARLRRLYFGAGDPKGGGVENGARIFDQSSCHHRPDVYGGIGETRSADLLRTFFADRRG